MSTLITSAQQQFGIQAIDALNLPDDAKSLLTLFEVSPTHPVKICALAKIKNQIIISLHSPINPEKSDNLSSEDFQEKQSRRKVSNINGWTEDPHNLFTRVLLRFLNRSSSSRNFCKNETRLFFHVVSLAIKYFYDEEEFRYLFNAITDLIDSHKEKVQTALEFFEEVISTIQYNGEKEEQIISGQQHSKISHCHFERHFTTNHLNSMLMIANFLLEKSILRDSEALDDGVTEDSFKIKSSQEQLLAIFSLLHRVFCFDFIGEKYSQSEQLSELGSIIIPTKSIRQNTFSQFQKWIKNSQWIRIYQFIYGSCRMIKLKLIIIDILGDMSRIHMKYFKNKVNYKIHIENIIFSLADILQQIKLSGNIQESLQISLAVGRNLLKLTSPSVLPLFFEINQNISKGLLDSIKKFLIEQIIQEQILNVNIIYYFFKFIENLSNRTKFQKTTIPQEIVEERMRQIGRSYENYLRNMMNKIFKQNYSRLNQTYHHRSDYINLKEIFKNYEISELLIFFVPFKIMKPRYPSINSIYDLVVVLCAKFIRSVATLEEPRLESWQRDISVGSISQCIDKIIEWQSFTTYHKKLKQKNAKKQGRYSHSLFVEKTQYARLSMQPIREEYDEQIENQYEYCHFLRVVCFCIIEVLNQKEVIFLSRVNKQNSLYRLVNIILELVFKSDLVDPANEQHKNSTSAHKIQFYLEECYFMVSKLLLKQFQYILLNVMRSNQYKYRQFYYRYAVEEAEIELIESIQIHNKMLIIERIESLKESSLPQQNEKALLALQFLLIYSVSFPLKKDLTDRIFIKDISHCLTYLQVIEMNTTILALIHQREEKIFTFLQELMTFLVSYQFKSDSNKEIMAYFKCFNIIINLSISQLSEEALNKTFVGLKFLMYFLSTNQQMKLDEEFCSFLEAISKDILDRSQDLQFIELREQIASMLKSFEISNHRQQPQQQQKMEIEDTIQDIVQLQYQQSQSMSDYKFTNQKQNSALNGQHHRISEKNEKPLEMQIYNGYHRQKTLSIMDRYISQEEERQAISIENQCAHYGDNQFLSQRANQSQQTSKDNLCETDQQILHKPNSDSYYQQRNNGEYPMEIEELVPQYKNNEENIKQQGQQRDSKDDIVQSQNEDTNEIDKSNENINGAYLTNLSEKQVDESKQQELNISNDKQPLTKIQKQQISNNTNIFIEAQQPQNCESRQLKQHEQSSCSVTIVIDSSNEITDQETPINYEANEKITQIISQQIQQESIIANQQSQLSLQQNQSE